MLGWAVNLFHGVLAQSKWERIHSKDGASILCNVGTALLAEAAGDFAFGWDKVANIGLPVKGDVLRLEGRRTNKSRASAAPAKRAMAIKGDLTASFLLVRCLNYAI